MDHNKSESMKNRDIVNSDKVTNDEISNTDQRSMNTNEDDLFTLSSSKLSNSTKQHGSTSAQELNNLLHGYDDKSDNVSSKFNNAQADSPGPSSSKQNQVFSEGGMNVDLQSNSDLSVPSTSGVKVANKIPAGSINNVVSRKRPSSLKLNNFNCDDHESSSDTGNDDYSLGSEDGCIYTYRGGEHLADLPSSFFSLDMGLPHDNHLPVPPHYQVRAENSPANRGRESRASSPDMDFLEMDFDPGPSCEVDTGDESSPDCDLNGDNEMPNEDMPVVREETPEKQPVAATSALDSNSHVKNTMQCYSAPSTSRGLNGDGACSSSSVVVYGKYITHVNTKGEKLLVRRTTSCLTKTGSAKLHNSSGDLISPREILTSEEEESLAQFTPQVNHGDNASMSTLLYHLNMAKKLILDTSKAAVKKEVSSMSIDNKINKTDTEEACTAETPCSMIWPEWEAYDRQVTQIGTSACGATAIVNAFLALSIPVDRDKISAAVGTRQRANSAALPRYLLSRSVAGCTAADLMSGIHKASDGLVAARFFPTYPERAVSLSHWLADWISLGAVPILTLNLQAGCLPKDTPDAWHHQMVFGVSPRGIYLCNPVECVPEEELWPRLSSPSVLLVRTTDVISRFTPHTDLTPLMAVPDRRYHTFNVLGQVVNVIREWRAAGFSEEDMRTKHVKIPASYQAGVTVAALAGTEAHRRLVHASQLPILAPQTQLWQT